MKYFFLAVFFLVDTVHLTASLKQDTRARNISKPFLLLSILGFYCTAAREISVFIVLALIFSWIGDLLLIPKGNRWLACGGVAFMIGHAFFTAGYRRDIDFSNVPTALILILAVIFFTAAVCLFLKLKPWLPKALVPLLFLYLLINGTMNCFADFRAVSMGTWPGILTAVGAALFYVSDALLFFVRFKKDCRIKTHFPVMLTYSAGVFLIVLGLL